MSLDLRYEVQLRLYLLGPPRSDLQMRATREYTACNEEEEEMVNGSEGRAFHFSPASPSLVSNVS